TPPASATRSTAVSDSKSAVAPGKTNHHEASPARLTQRTAKPYRTHARCVGSTERSWRACARMGRRLASWTKASHSEWRARRETLGQRPADVDLHLDAR